MVNSFDSRRLRICNSVNTLDLMSKEIRDALLAQIRAELAYREITQKELAGRIGMDPAVLSRYMRAKRDMPMNVYFDISAAMGLSPDYLMTKAAMKSK